MELQELRIGNYYHWEAEGKDYVMPVMRGDFSNDNYKNFKPIPLTEEWLEKLGLSHTLSNCPFKIDSWCIRIPCEWGNQLMIEAKVEEVEKGIEAYLIATHARALRVERKYQYVHQLQNLYFDLTNKELTIKP